jgi:hypothetical protein
MADFAAHDYPDPARPQIYPDLVLAHRADGPFDDIPGFKLLELGTREEFVHCYIVIR